jgi:hypothetical protein
MRKTRNRPVRPVGNDDLRQHLRDWLYTAAVNVVDEARLLEDAGWPWAHSQEPAHEASVDLAALLADTETWTLTGLLAAVTPVCQEFWPQDSPETQPVHDAVERLRRVEMIVRYSNLIEAGRGLLAGPRRLRVVS